MSRVIKSVGRTGGRLPPGAIFAQRFPPGWLVLSAGWDGAVATGILSVQMPEKTRSLKVASTGCAAKLRVLADPTRLAVMEALISGAKHVGAIQKLLGVEQSLLSHHLQTLREAGLVEAERDGKSVLYRIADNVVGPEGDALDLGCCVLSFND